MFRIFTVENCPNLEKSFNLVCDKSFEYVLSTMYSIYNNLLEKKKEKLYVVLTKNLLYRSNQVAN